MTPAPSRKTGGRGGTTLVELLIAISISAVVVAVALSVYATVNGSLRRQQSQQWRQAALALDAIRRDMAGVIQTSFSNAPPLELELESRDPLLPPETLSASLRLCTGTVPQGHSVERLAAAQIRYRLIPVSGQADGGDLVREYRLLTGPSTLLPDSATNVMVRNISGFTVALLDRGAWTNHWVHRPGRRPPQAADVAISWTSGPTTQTARILALIPAGAAFPGRAPPPSR